MCSFITGGITGGITAGITAGGAAGGLTMLGLAMVGVGISLSLLDRHIPARRTSDRVVGATSIAAGN